MINVEIDNKNYEFKKGINLENIMEKINHKDKNIIVAAIINNRIQKLSKKIDSDCKIKFLTRSDVLGNRIYRRSLFMVMARAIYKLFPESVLAIEHSLSNGIYCELHKEGSLEPQDLQRIYSEMIKIVKADLPIRCKQFTRDEVIDIYKKQGFDDKVKFIKNCNRSKFILYELDGFFDYFYYHMVPSTGYLNKFDLHFTYPGFILLFPQKSNPFEVPAFINQPKLAHVFNEYEKLGDILGVSTLYGLNKLIEKGKHSELVMIAEALHEKKIARIADEIYDSIDNKQIILIAGPSSSGKTTFTQRLSIQLKINCLKPVAISVDNYFVNREDTPRDEKGDYDFEALEAIDLQLFNRHLLKLLRGESIEIPVFDFKTGKRKYTGNKLQVKGNQPILIEGIHGLNDKLTGVIPQDHKYKIYVSALTQLNIDRHNRIPTTDTRILRRIVRDYKFRGHNASSTITRWPSVRRGEERNIFPYQENADIMFNSALIYELAILKSFAQPLLEEIGPEEEVYYEAERLLEILSCFIKMSPVDIPKASILREFIGNSIFR